MNESAGTNQEPALNKYFRVAIKTQANDLHLKVGQPPKLRIKSDLKNTTGEAISKEKMEQLVFEILTPEQKKTLLKTGTVDLGYDIVNEGRFRINIFRQMGKISLAARRINDEILSFEKLNLPPILSKISDGNHGFVLVVGHTGCGKTTTAASMVEFINQNRCCHIITIEDPVEYIFKDKKAMVTQREVGIDIESFESALKYLVRQDPDVIFIGEMRDALTVDAAMKAAETGHLVFGTMHATSSALAVQRLLDLFPQQQRDLMRQTLAVCIKAIVCQALLPCIKEDIDRVPAVEIMLANSTARKLISEARETELPNLIRSCKEEGMIDITDSLCELIQEGCVEPKVAYEFAPNVDELKMAMKGIRADITGIL